MNLFHYILLTLSILGTLSSLKSAYKEKNTMGFIAGVFVNILWCALIVLSAYN